MSRAKSSGTGRLRKISCDDCGTILYGSAAAIRTHGLPGCGCGGRYAVANLRDLEAIDPDEFERVTDALSERARNQVMRELGHTAEIVKRNAGRRSRQPQCSEPGCSRFRAYGVKFCATHEELHAVPF